MTEDCREIFEMCKSKAPIFNERGFGMALNNFVYLLTQVFPDDAAEIVREMEGIQDKPKRRKKKRTQRQKVTRKKSSGCASCPEPEKVMTIMEQIDGITNEKQFVEFFEKNYNGNALDKAKELMRSLDYDLKGNHSLSGLAKKYFAE